MSRASSPLRQVIETTNVDEARATFTKTYTKVTLEPEAHVPFGFSHTVVGLGAVRVARDEWCSGGQLATTELDDRYIVAFSTTGTAGGKQAAEEFVMVPGRHGIMLSPQQPCSIRHDGRFCTETITIERQVLEVHWTNLTGRSSPRTIRFSTGLDLGSPSSIAVHGVAQLFRGETEPPGRSRLVVAGLRDALLTTLLTAQPHSASALLAAAPPQVAPASVRRAEEYIVAHVAEPITLADIVAATGVSARSLQATFQTYRGTTPMAFLRERRLELARRRLQQEGSNASVGEILRALTASPGRFSGDYAKRFGESPSETHERASAKRDRATPNQQPIT